MIEVKKISGVHNYCNRWCERCRFANRCEVALHEAKSKIHASDKNVWDTVQSNLNEAFELLKSMLKEMEEDFENTISDEISNHDLIAPQKLTAEISAPKKELFLHINKTSKDYGFAAINWFDNTEDILKIKEEQLNQLHNIGAKDIIHEAQILKEAISIVEWNMFLIGAKLNRATADDDFPMIDDDPIQTDANGSAKVALIAIDDSLAAWNIIRETIPELSDESLDMLAMLSRLKKDSLKAFPDAHKFIRPGFDTEE